MDVKELQKKVIEYRDKRDWKQFHNPKDVAISLLLEASEIIEHFQWKNNEEIEQHLMTHKDEVADEISDVLYWVLLMSYDLDIDLVKSFNKKMKENEKKYPINKSKGKHTKYNKL